MIMVYSLDFTDSECLQSAVYIAFWTQLRVELYGALKQPKDNYTNRTNKENSSSMYAIKCIKNTQNKYTHQFIFKMLLCLF